MQALLWKAQNCISKETFETEKHCLCKTTNGKWTQIETLNYLSKTVIVLMQKQTINSKFKCQRLYIY